MQRIAAGIAAAMPLLVMCERPFLTKTDRCVAGIIADYEFAIALGNGTATAALGILRALNV